MQVEQSLMKGLSPFFKPIVLDTMYIMSNTFGMLIEL